MDGMYAHADAKSTDEGAPEKEEAAPPKSIDEENAGATEILVGKDKLPEGIKEGDECRFRVTKDFGDELSLEYVKDEEKGSKTEQHEDMGVEGELAELSSGSERSSE